MLSLPVAHLSSKALNCWESQWGPGPHTLSQDLPVSLNNLYPKLLDLSPWDYDPSWSVIVLKGVMLSIKSDRPVGDGEVIVFFHFHLNFFYKRILMPGGSMVGEGQALAVHLGQGSETALGFSFFCTPPPPHWTWSSPTCFIISRSDMPYEKTWLKTVYTSFLGSPWLFPKRVPVRLRRGDFSNPLSKLPVRAGLFSRSN